MVKFFNCCLLAIVFLLLLALVRIARIDNCGNDATASGFRGRSVSAPYSDNGASSDNPNDEDDVDVDVDVDADAEAEDIEDDSGSNSMKRTMLLYMTNKDGAIHTEHIKELANEFGDEFMVVWDNKEKPTCPHQSYARCLEEWRVSDTRRLSHRCCAQEKAVMWAMDNRHTFDYIWMMEDDVHYTDVAELRRVIHLQSSSADLLNEWNKHNATSKWFYFEEAVTQFLPWLPRDQAESVISHSMLNLYRMSSQFLMSLEDAYEKLGNNWVFFEHMFPTLTDLYNLTYDNWVNLDELNPASSNNLSGKKWTYGMRHRPCYTDFTLPGVFHPVKWDENGNVVPCDVPQTAEKTEK